MPFLRHGLLKADWSTPFQIGYKGFILYLFFLPFVIFVVIAGSLLTGVANDQDIPIDSFR